MKHRHVPVRSCIVCREKLPKRDLFRIVRTPQGSVELDRTGKQPGRGCYLCHQEDCWHKALSRDRLDHSLHAQMTREEKEQLISYAAVLVGCTQA